MRFFVSWHELVLGAVTCSSVLHSVLPPWDWDVAVLADFPRTQAFVIRIIRNRWYKLGVNLVGFASITLRSRVWPSISMSAQFDKMQNGGTS